MKNPRPVCPNAACENHTDPPRGFYRKNGTRRTAHNRQRVPRYQCRACGRSFCATTAKPIRQQHRPDLNSQIFRLAVSGVSMRRMEQLVGCSKSTIARKLAYLAGQAQSQHMEWLADLQTSYVMMDELMTFVHARAKPLSVAVVVRVKTGEVIGFTVSRLRGHDASQFKYPWPMTTPR